MQLLARANGQWGVLHYRDLLEAGLGEEAIVKRAQQGRLTRLHHLVYAFGHTALRDEGRWLAATWAAGESAVLSHTSAGAYHEMLKQADGSPVHVSTTRESVSRVGIVVHRVRQLARVDIFHPHPLLVTTIPRTLIDLADVLPWDEYRAVADNLPELRLDMVKEAQRRARGRRGAPLVTRLIEADDAHTKSEFERRFLRFSRTHSLPRPDHLNLRLAGHKADCIYDHARLVIELDGRTHHRRRSQMRKDRKRDTDYQLAGYRILRLVWDDLHPDEANETAERVRQMLAAGTRAV